MAGSEPKMPLDPTDPKAQLMEDLEAGDDADLVLGGLKADPDEGGEFKLG